MIYYIDFEISGDPCNLIGSYLCALFTNRIIFCSKSRLFPSQRGSFIKIQKPIACFKIPIKLHENNKNTTKALATSSNQLTTGSTKYLNRLENPMSKQLILQFKYWCNKVVNELRIMQFGSDKILAISNHAYDFRPSKIHEKTTQFWLVNINIVFG